MTIAEIAEKAGPYQRFVRESWDRPFKFWHAFNSNGAMFSKDSLNWALTRHELKADDWKLVEAEDLAQD
jgi:hypothetical protein